MITITKIAAEQIRNAAVQSGADNMALRIAAKITPAGMLEFGMGFDEERENDQIVDSWGISVLISEHSKGLLDDVTVDFAEVAPGENGFVFMKAASAGSESAGGCGGGGCGGGSCGTGGGCGS